MIIIEKEEKRRNGKDDMNLVEFPFSVLCKKSKETVISFEREERDKAGNLIKKKWKIKGDPEYGLPKPSTEDLLLVLLELAKEQSNFQDRTVYFTRGELLERMNIDNKQGYCYKKLIEDLEILKSVFVVYTNSFWHNKQKKNITRMVGILGSIQIFDEKGNKSADQPLFKSYVIFSDEYFEALQLSYIKNIDSTFYFQLDSPITKKLYRILDKRFHKRNVVFFNLQELAFTMIGLSKNYTTGKIKQCLNKAHNELKEKGFCTHKYKKIKAGVWQVFYYKLIETKSQESTEEHKSELELPELYKKLSSFGIAEAQIRKLREEKENILKSDVRKEIDFNSYSFEKYLAEKLATFEFEKKRSDQGERAEIKNVPAFLWKMITENYKSESYEKEKVSQQQLEENRRRKEEEEAKGKREAKERKEEEKRIREENEQLFESLTDEEKMEIFKEAKEKYPFPQRIGNPENEEDIKSILDEKIFFGFTFYEIMNDLIRDRK